MQANSWLMGIVGGESVDEAFLAGDGVCDGFDGMGVAEALCWVGGEVVFMAALSEKFGSTPNASSASAHKEMAMQPEMTKAVPIKIHLTGWR